MIIILTWLLSCALVGFTSAIDVPQCSLHNTSTGTIICQYNIVALLSATKPGVTYAGLALFAGATYTCQRQANELGCESLGMCMWSNTSFTCNVDPNGVGILTKLACKDSEASKLLHCVTRDYKDACDAWSSMYGCMYISDKCTTSLGLKMIPNSEAYNETIVAHYEAASTDLWGSCPGQAIVANQRVVGSSIRSDQSPGALAATVLGGTYASAAAQCAELSAGSCQRAAYVSFPTSAPYEALTTKSCLVLANTPSCLPMPSYAMSLVVPAASILLAGVLAFLVL